MAKGGKGKGKKDKNKVEEVKDPNAVTEVDKTFYELQITDLNRKLARLRELTANLEEKNSDLEQKYTQLDEDRADVISYLKRQLTDKQNEATELKERLIALQAEKDADAEKFEQKVKDMDEEYRVMKEQLTSEIKLISGKLNALEEFRIHRDELMKKFVDQEKEIEEQEIRHKRTLYEAEKMFIMSKDTIKKDMEKRIIELAKDFQAANEIRIAATTHRAIRENIIINKEMDKLQEIIERLTKENNTYKFKNRDLRQNCDLYMEERNIALDRAKIHRGVIDQLRSRYKKLFNDIEEYKKIANAAKEKERELRKCQEEIENLNIKVRILEQNLHATQCETFAAKKILEEAEKKTQQFQNIIFESCDAIKQSLQVTLQDESEKYSKRESLLYYLLRLINEGHQEAIRVESTDTIETVKAAYIRGDLGFVPKAITPTKKRSAYKLHMDTQVGKSLEDLQKRVSSEITWLESEFSLPNIETRSELRIEEEEDEKEKREDEKEFTFLSDETSEEENLSSKKEVTSQILDSSQFEAGGFEMEGFEQEEYDFGTEISEHIQEEENIEQEGEESGV